MSALAQTNSKAWAQKSSPLARHSFRAVPELIESEGIHKEAEAVESALVQDGGSDDLFEGSARSIDWFG